MAFGSQYARAKFPHHCLQTGAAGRHHVPSFDIGVDDRHLVLGKQVRYQGFSRRNATGQGNHKRLWLWCRRHKLESGGVQVPVKQLIAIHQGDPGANGQIRAKRNGLAAFVSRQ